MLAALQGALGQLQRELRGIETVLGKHAVDVLEQVAVLELPRGQVHVQRQRLRAGPPAAVEVAAGLAEQPASDGDDQPGLLGERHEVLRRDQPALGMRPADQRLEALDAAAGDVHDGQIVNAELLARQGVAQFRLQLEQVRSALPHLRVEHCGMSPTLRFGAVHRRGGIGKQVLHPGICGRARGDADADREGKLLCRNLEGPRHCLVDAARHHLRGAGSGKIFEQHGELVGAQAREQVALAQAGL